MTNRDHEPSENEFDAYEKHLRSEYRRNAVPAVIDAETDAIWNAMQVELQRTRVGGAVPPVADTSRGSYFSLGNLLAFTTAGVLIAVSSVFVVAVKQRHDGTVVSTVTHLERIMRRNHTVEKASNEWLPEEREIWKQLLSETTEGIDPDQAVVWAK